MSDEEKIQQFLVKSDLTLSGPLARQDIGGPNYFAFVEITSDQKGHQQPSNKRLAGIADQLKVMGFGVDFVLNDTENRDLEKGLRATLLHSYPNDVRNAFMTRTGDKIVAWIVPKSAAARKKSAQFLKTVDTYVTNVGLNLETVKLTIDEDLPTRFAILTALRIGAPESADDIARRLANLGFTSPPNDYLARHLDGLRKSGQVIRRKDGRFVLTYRALKSLGSAKRRGSPDVTRLLDLARRGD